MWISRLQHQSPRCATNCIPHFAERFSSISVPVVRLVWKDALESARYVILATVGVLVEP